MEWITILFPYLLEKEADDRGGAEARKAFLSIATELNLKVHDAAHDFAPFAVSRLKLSADDYVHPNAFAMSLVADSLLRNFKKELQP
jgi:lysophospholipase L1-like esterase